MFTFTIDYLILIILASIGVIQLGALYGGLKGLLFSKSIVFTHFVGFSLPVTAFTWFFMTDSRNINDYAGGLDSNTQALLFFLGASTGWILTTILSFIINIHMKRKDLSPFEGLDSLKKTNYFNALLFNLKYWWSNWRLQMKRYLLR
jgi:hypothetical protein